MNRFELLRNSLPAACLATVIVGCAGTPFRWDDARKIKDGMTTKEVSALVGTPTAVKATGDTLRYVWVEVNGFTGSSKTLTVDFRNNRVIKAPPIPDDFR